MKPSLVQIPRRGDDLGAIGIIEGAGLLPFAVRRVYFIHGVPQGAIRGSHAHKQLEQLLVAVSGSVTVRLDDGVEEVQYQLGEPGVGLLVPPGYWRTLTDFSPHTVVVVIASREYDESDYLRDYDAFLAWKLDG